MHGLEPIAGPAPLTQEWYDARFTTIGASDSARACGVSENGGPLDVYAEKCGLVEPFEGNEYTERGKRFEPFILQEYSERTGARLETGLPMYVHPLRKHVSATPDARHADNHRHLVEAKLCNWRRAAALGEEYSDHVFPDWVCQAQQQMAVLDGELCDVFVMVDAHTYRLFTVERNDKLIDAMMAAEDDLWSRIERRDPPAPNFRHPEAFESVKKVFGMAGGVIPLTTEIAEIWRTAQECNDQIKELTAQRDEARARVLFFMGEATAARFPLGQREIARTVVKDSIWTETDVQVAKASLGKVKRKGHVRLTERAVKE